MVGTVFEVAFEEFLFIGGGLIAGTDGVLVFEREDLALRNGVR
jgi:hypothetical protein